jgi:hypothetical protein
MIVWYALSGGWAGDASFSVVGSFFSGLWAVADSVGSLLYTRRGASRGRGLRVLGYAVFFPLALGCYLVAFWSTSTFMLVVEAVLLGGWFVWLAIRLVRLAWQRR